MSAPSATSSGRSAPSREQILHGSGSVAWDQVIGFVLLAYGLAWAIWVALLGPTIKEALQDGRTPAHFAATAAVTLGMYAPALAAVVMRVFSSKEGLRRALGPLPSLKIGLAALLLPLALVLILVAIVTMINIGEPTPGKPMGSLLTILTFVGVPIGTLLAFGEEFGWRGYLLPKLLPLGEVKAALIVGLIWGPWHLPVLIVGLNYPGQPITAVLAVFLLSATLVHGSLNTFSDRLTDQNHLSGNPLIVSAGGLIASALLAIGMFINYRVLARRTAS